MTSTRRDNFPPLPERPNGVDRLEDALRGSFAYAAGSGLSPRRDLAEVAIRTGRRQHRRRLLGGTAVLAAVTLLASGGVVFLHLPGGRPRPAAPAAAERPAADITATEAQAETLVAPGPARTTQPLGASPLPVDVIADHLLLAREGVRIDLSPVGTPAAGYRVADGYLVVATSAGGATIWFASASASPRRLVTGSLRAVAVDPDGARISWREPGQVGVATVEAGQLVKPRYTTATAEVQPVGFTGPAVWLARVLADGAHAGQDRWLPDRGRYVPAWDNDALAVYGALPDGRTLIGQVAGSGSGAQRCLAMLDSTTLRATKTRCDLALAPQSQGWLSPGGRWLVAEVTGRSGPEAALVDLRGAFTGRVRTVPLGAPPRGGVIWEDEHTLVRALRSTLQRLRLDRLWDGRGGGAEEFPVPGAAAGARILVVTGG
ncbi:MAG TPA: hypothetical protein VFB84_18870 [Micromonosporaceae bacterium]|nr:hypothetical protein [Micromonosporaceae bacterium]